MKNLTEIKIQKIGHNNELSESVFKIDMNKYTFAQAVEMFEKIYHCKKVFLNHQIMIFVGGMNGRNVFKVDVFSFKKLNKKQGE